MLEAVLFIWLQQPNLTLGRLMLSLGGCEELAETSDLDLLQAIKDKFELI